VYVHLMVGRGSRSLYWC